MRIPLHIAEKLLLLCQGEIFQASSLRHPVIEELIAEGLLERTGRVRKTITLYDEKALKTYLQNRCGISDLKAYVEAGLKEDVSRSELVSVSSDSKLRKVRTFKGFLVNSYFPVEAELNGEPIVIHPKEGTFQFIYDFERLKVPGDVIIVGVENPENFRRISSQKYLFGENKSLFVSRYPQSQGRDLIKWLQGIPNKYTHFGDFDFAGIGIYENEYKRYLSKKGSFFIPENIEKLIRKHGNRERYDVQKINFEIPEDEEILKLIAIIHKCKKGLDQEILITEKEF